MQTHLRRLTHQILTAQEAERKKISHELRDEIAQTLLGIKVRLVTLSRTAKGGTASLKKEIANTQRLVQESVRSINQFARKLYSRRTAGLDRFVTAPWGGAPRTTPLPRTWLAGS